MSKRVLTSRPYQFQSYYCDKEPHETTEPLSSDDRSIVPKTKDIFNEIADLSKDSTSSGASDKLLRLFPPPVKRSCPANDKPVYKNGQCIPRKEALLMEMILSDKATLKAQLDVTKQPIVGLEFLLEFIDPDGTSPRVYNCTLCKTFRTVNTIMEHITGYNHRVNYIQKKFPSEVKMFLLPDGRTKNRHRALMQVASKRCSELELVYGRGDYVIKNEKAKIPEGALDAAESETMLVEGKQLDFLKNTLKEIGKLKIESDEEARLAKSICNALANCICEFKFSKTNG